MLHSKISFVICALAFASVVAGKHEKIWPKQLRQSAESSEKTQHGHRAKRSYPFGLNEVNAQNASFDTVYTKDVNKGVLHSFTYTEQTNMVSRCY